MQEPGFVSDELTIKLAILYIISFFDAQASYLTLTETILKDGLVNFFDFSAALEGLTASGHLLFLPDEKSYKITSQGKDAISLFQNRIPFSLRERLTKAAKEQKSR